jgi:hypothetical protein
MSSSSPAWRKNARTIVTPSPPQRFMTKIAATRRVRSNARPSGVSKNARCPGVREPPRVRAIQPRRVDRGTPTSRAAAVGVRPRSRRACSKSTTVAQTSAREARRGAQRGCVTADSTAACGGTARLGGGWSQQPVSCCQTGRACNPRLKLHRRASVAGLGARPQAVTLTGCAAVVPRTIATATTCPTPRTSAATCPPARCPTPRAPGARSRLRHPRRPCARCVPRARRALPLQRLPPRPRPRLPPRPPPPLRPPPRRPSFVAAS